MGTVQSLSRTSQAAFIAVLVVPLVALLAWLNLGSQTFTVDAEVALLPDGRTVASTFETNSCDEPLRLDIDESAQEVRVRTLVRRVGRLRGCDDFAETQRLVGTLAEPLGTRTLVAVPADPRNDR